MGILQNISSMFGGGGSMENLAAGRGDFSDASSADHQNFQSMVSQAPPGILQSIFSHAAQKMDPQTYSDHISGASGTNPLASLGGGGLATIATALMSRLGGAGGASSLLSRIPGLNTTDPQQMNADQVASVARYTQQNHPDIFGQAAADVGQQQPDLLHSMLGKAGLAIGAAALASHFMKPDHQ